MKRLLIIIFTMVSMTKPIIGSETTKLLTGKLTQKTLHALTEVYNNPDKTDSPNITEIIEYHNNNENQLEKGAYTALLPKLVTQIKADAKNYWFKKYDEKSFPWYKIVDSAIKKHNGLANDFMAYLYDLNIKGLNKKDIQELSDKSGIKIENGYYIISENKFKKALSFSQKHWGKLATGAALGAAAIGSAALYLNQQNRKLQNMEEIKKQNLNRQKQEFKKQKQDLDQWNEKMEKKDLDRKNKEIEDEKAYQLLSLKRIQQAAYLGGIIALIEKARPGSAFLAGSTAAAGTAIAAGQAAMAGAAGIFAPRIMKRSAHQSPWLGISSANTFSGTDF